MFDFAASSPPSSSLSPVLFRNAGRTLDQTIRFCAIRDLWRRMFCIWHSHSGFAHQGSSVLLFGFSVLVRIAGSMARFYSMVLLDGFTFRRYCRSALLDCTPAVASRPALLELRTWRADSLTDRLLSYWKSLFVLEISLRFGNLSLSLSLSVERNLRTKSLYQLYQLEIFHRRVESPTG